jgi:hypothetical protein
MEEIVIVRKLNGDEKWLIRHIKNVWAKEGKWFVLCKDDTEGEIDEESYLRVLEHKPLIKFLLNL